VAAPICMAAANAMQDADISIDVLTSLFMPI